MRVIPGSGRDQIAVSGVPTAGAGVRSLAAPAGGAGATGSAVAGVAAAAGACGSAGSAKLADATVANQNKRIAL